MVNKAAYLTAANRTAARSEQHHKVPSVTHSQDKQWLEFAWEQIPESIKSGCLPVKQLITYLLHRCFYTMAVTMYIQVNTYFKDFELKIIAYRIKINISISPLCTPNWGSKKPNKSVNLQPRPLQKKEAETFCPRFLADIVHNHGVGFAITLLKFPRAAQVSWAKQTLLLGTCPL